MHILTLLFGFQFNFQQEPLLKLKFIVQFNFFKQPLFSVLTNSWGSFVKTLYISWLDLPHYSY